MFIYFIPILYILFKHFYHLNNILSFILYLPKFQDNLQLISQNYIYHFY